MQRDSPTSPKPSKNFFPAQTISFVSRKQKKDNKDSHCTNRGLMSNQPERRAKLRAYQLLRSEDNVSQGGDEASSDDEWSEQGERARNASGRRTRRKKRKYMDSYTEISAPTMPSLQLQPSSSTTVEVNDGSEGSLPPPGQEQRAATLLDNVATINRITSRALCIVENGKLENMSNHQIKVLSDTLKMEIYPLAAKGALIQQNTVEQFLTREKDEQGRAGHPIDASSGKSTVSTEDLAQHFSDITRATESESVDKLEIRVKQTYLASFSHKIADDDKRTELLNALPDGSGGYHKSDIAEMAAAGRILSGKYSRDDGTESLRFNHVLDYLTNDGRAAGTHIQNPSLSHSPSDSRRTKLITDIHSNLTDMNSRLRVEQVVDFCRTVKCNQRNEATLQFHTISQLLREFLAPWENKATFLDV